MALTVAGFRSEALRAYQWLVDTQLPEGAWFNYYVAGTGVDDTRLDTNVCAYIAAGVWHLYLSTRDLGVLEELWPTVDRAIAFVLRSQTEDGTVRWSIDPDGRPGRYALLTGSSSIHHSLRCGVACAETLGLERPDWELAAGRLAHVIALSVTRGLPSAFEPKREFAMDWYYPVLCGALQGAAADRHLQRLWDTFVMEGLGVRCVFTDPWVTAAETAECALALDVVGRSELAAQLITWAQAHRRPDGTYWTGIVYPGGTTFPFEEHTTYTAAAILLAADAVSHATAASGLFRGDGLPGYSLDFLTRCAIRSEPHALVSANSPESSAARHTS
jgi:hypothetical protein